MGELFNIMDAPIAPKPNTQEMALAGMQQAADHADAVEESWGERAYQLLTGYAVEHFEFMTEEVRVWAHSIGLPKPPDGRAWGAVTHRAVRAGIITCHRYRKTKVPPAHATPRPVWRSNIFQGLAA